MDWASYIRGYMSRIFTYWKSLKSQAFIGTQQNDLLNTCLDNSVPGYLASKEFKHWLSDGLSILVPIIISIYFINFFYVYKRKNIDENYQNLLKKNLHLIPVVSLLLALDCLHQESAYKNISDSLLIEMLGSAILIYLVFMISTLLYASYYFTCLNNFRSFFINFILLGLFCYSDDRLFDQFPDFLNPKMNNLLLMALKILFGEDFLLMLGSFSTMVIHSLLVLLAICLLYLIVNATFYILTLIYRVIVLSIIIALMVLFLKCLKKLNIFRFERRTNEDNNYEEKIIFDMLE